MLKKKIIFGSVVLLLAALFALTGCSQATDSDGGVTAYSENHLFGTATADDVARAVRSAKATGRSVVLTDQTTIIGAAGLPTVADFEDLPVRVEGQVYVGGGTTPPDVIVNAARANLSFEPDARIDLLENGAFIYSGDGEHIYTSHASAYKVKFVSNPLEGAQGTDARIAVADFQLGANFSNVANHVSNLYVLDKVTVDAQSVNPGAGTTAGTPAIIALGEVDLTENNSASFTAVGTNFRFTRDSVLTSSAPGSVTIGVPTPAVLPTIKAAKPITVAGPASAGVLTIGAIEGPETVTISNSVSLTLTIGNVTETGTAAVDTPTLTAGTITNNAGTVNVTASTTVTAFTVNGNNTGEINFNTPTYVALTVSAAGRNAGTIDITAPAITGAIQVSNNAAGGVLNLNAATKVGGAVTVATNSGQINYATPLIDTGVSTVTTNNGEINFIQDIAPTLANFLKVPSNRGVINFKGSLTTATSITLGSTTPADSIAGPGKVVFGGLATLGGPTIIGSDAEFSGGVTVPGAAAGDTLTLNGDVTLGYEQAITLTTVESILTLGAGKRILLGTTPVLAAGSAPVVITPVAGAVLTAGTELPGDSDDPETFIGNKALTLGGTAVTAAIEVTSGELKVPGALIVGTATGVTVSGSLTVEDGGILGFPATAPTFKVVLGDTQITGAATLSRLTASGGAVTLAANLISGRGSTLAAVPDMGSPVITVDPGTAAGSKLLTITGANLDLSGGGSLVVAGHGTANRVILSSGGTPGSGGNPGKLTLGEDKVYSITSLNGKKLGTLPLSGNGVVLGDNEVLPATVGELAATEASNLTITGLAANVSIAAGLSVTN
jgi:hypothetical protein